MWRIRFPHLEAERLVIRCGLPVASLLLWPVAEGKVRIAQLSSRRPRNTDLRPKSSYMYVVEVIERTSISLQARAPCEHTTGLGHLSHSYL